MLRPIVGHALDAAVAVPVEWSVVPILAGDGGDWVYGVLGSARRRCAARVVGDLEGAAGGSGVADRVELFGAGGACRLVGCDEFGGAVSGPIRRMPA